MVQAFNFLIVLNYFATESTVPTQIVSIDRVSIAVESTTVESLADSKVSTSEVPTEQEANAKTSVKM